jgi:hypothetical protein
MSSGSSQDDILRRPEAGNLDSLMGETVRRNLGVTGLGPSPRPQQSYEYSQERAGL